MSYKIKPAKIQAKYHLDINSIPHEKCFLGVSLESQFINGKHVGRVLQWVDTNFKSCIVVIGDSVHRYNEIISGSNEEDAVKKCNELGDLAVNKLRIELEKVHAGKFQIHRWHTYTTNAKFSDYHKQYKTLFEENNECRSAVELCATNFLTKQKERGKPIAVSHDEAMRLSIEYIIEEMAVFSILISEGYSTLVYPGTILQIFKDIVNEVFPGLQTILKEGIYIDLNIKKQ